MELSAYDCLLLAFANLASYGIEVRRVDAACRAGEQAALAAELAERFAHGMGSFLVWSTIERAKSGVCVRLDGSDAGVVGATRAALTQMGLVACDGAQLHALVVDLGHGAATTRPTTRPVWPRPQA